MFDRGVEKTSGQWERACRSTSPPGPLPARGEGVWGWGLDRTTPSDRVRREYFSTAVSDHIDIVSDPWYTGVESSPRWCIALKARPEGRSQGGCAALARSGFSLPPGPLHPVKCKDKSASILRPA